MRDEAEVVRVDVRVGAAANAIRPGIINIEVEKISSCQDNMFMGSFESTYTDDDTF